MKIKNKIYIFGILLSISVMSCGGDGGSSGGTSTSTTTYSVSGTIIGAAGGDTVTLTNNGADSTVFTGDGTSPMDFTMPTKMSNGALYDIQVAGATGTNCTASVNFGTIASTNIINVAVHCGILRTLSVQVTNVTGPDPLGGSLTFLNNNIATDWKSVTLLNTPVAFTTKVVDGAGYNVTVQNQPAFNQVCSPVSGTNEGTMTGDKMADFTCSTASYSVDVSVVDLGGTGGVDGLILVNNNDAGDPIIPLLGSATYTFGNAVAVQTSYSVTIAQQPSVLSQTCVITGGTNGDGSGTRSVTGTETVIVTCTTNPFTVGGTVYGLTGAESVTVELNGINAQTPTGTVPGFTFPALLDGAAYAVTITSVPSDMACTLTNDTGNIAQNHVTNVAVDCKKCIGGGDVKTLVVSWTQSISYDVTTAAGGGHKVYYDTNPGITKATVNVLDVPKGTSLTTGTITGLTGGCKYYVRVGAYSAINTTGGNLTTEQSITVP